MESGKHWLENDEDDVDTKRLKTEHEDIDMFGGVEGEEGGESEDEEFFAGHHHDFASSHDFVDWLKEQRIQEADPKLVLLRLVEQFDLSKVPQSFLWDVSLALGMEIAKTFVAPRVKLEEFSSIDDFVSLLQNRQNIVVITGAGISASAGIPDFRSENGIYSIVKNIYNLPTPESIFNFNFFCTNPVPFFEFANKLWPKTHSPTASHQFIRMLEEQNKLLRNYTQNIDDLEGQAGITRKIQCHGSFATATCMTCRHTVVNDEIDADIQLKRIPYCKICVDPETELKFREIGFPEDMQGILKPDITFFGEPLPDEFFQHIQSDLNQVDLCIIMGSSMQVSPVANILEQLPAHVPLVLINREPVGYPHKFDIQLLGNCDEIVQFISLKLGLPIGKECQVQQYSNNTFLFPGHRIGRTEDRRLGKNELDDDPSDTEEVPVLLHYSDTGDSPNVSEE